MKSIYHKLLLCFLVLQSNILLAEGTSYGALAKGVLGPVDAITHLLKAICIVTGVGMILGALIKFGDHRRNPVQTGIGVPIAMILTGLALVALGFVPQLTYQPNS